MPKPPEWVVKALNVVIGVLLMVLGYLGSDLIAKVSAHETRIAVVESTVHDMKEDVHWIRQRLEGKH